MTQLASLVFGALGASQASPRRLIPASQPNAWQPACNPTEPNGPVSACNVRAEGEAINRRTVLMNMLVSSAALAAANTIAIAAVPATTETADPVFAALALHGVADAALAKAYDALEAAENELKEAGDLEPYVVSVGNPHSGLPIVRSTSHEQIDMYTPADMFPGRNREEHAALSAALARRADRLDPITEAVSAAEDHELKARRTVDAIEPATLEGALAALEFTRKYTL
jgi:hypothetical protein